jgi:hypothetical protein
MTQVSAAMVIERVELALSTHANSRRSKPL